MSVYLRPMVLYMIWHSQVCNIPDTSAIEENTSYIDLWISNRTILADILQISLDSLHNIYIFIITIY